ncbi:MAG: phytanoyl-CoA dioxygenase family protein [Alphaproteobacteria bacterium]
MVLSKEQIDAFWRDGYLMAPGGVSTEQLDALRAQLDRWVEDSRGHAENWGETLDGMTRFDLERGHSADAPRLRRVNNPEEVADAYAVASFEAATADMVADLIGPDVKFHHAKINTKQPRTDSKVGLHQDFSYTPHSNDDIVTALLLLDDMDDNGALEVVPGSHREGQKSLWQDGSFTGKLGPDDEAAVSARLVPLAGKAGDVCLMHTALIHGSAPNTSDKRRSLYISVYSAADAVALAPSPLPNRFEGRIVRGQPARRARLTVGEVELPSDHRGSFFHLSGQGTNAGG